MRPEDLKKYATDPAQNRSLVSGAIALVFSGLVWCAVQLTPMPQVDAGRTAASSPATRAGRSVSWASLRQDAVVGRAEMNHQPVRHFRTIRVEGDIRKFIGRSVDVRGTVVKAGNAKTFWVGDHGRRVFVVRDEEPPAVAASVPWEFWFPALPRGQEVRVQGTLEALPSPMNCEAWGLDAASHRELERTGVFIKAVRVMARR